jgi:GH24 family phage-related lysozyme (muramidase)/uncharacterized Zn-binding protein involved in type VI secretion
MPQAARTTDPISPHSPCSPGKCGPGSSDVLIENLQAYRVGDKTEPHGRKITGACVPHVTPLVNGSHNVFINGQPAGRVGDTHSCGIIVLSGSSKVSINGGGTGSVTPRENHHPPKQQFSSVPDNLTDYIKSKETFTAKAFWDNKQYTNGYGTKALSPTEIITEEEALRRLNKDLSQRRNFVANYSANNNRNWSPDQIDALTSFVFNLGTDTLNQLTDRGTRTDTQIAAKILEYNKETKNGVKVVVPGLTTRRIEESNWFKRGMN